MASQGNAIKAKLNASALWTDIFGARTYIADDLPDDGLKPSTAVYDTDGTTLLPHAVLAFGMGQEAEIVAISERRDLTLYLYEHRGYANIRAAQKLAKQLLNLQTAPSDDENANFMRWVGIGPEYKDDSMAGASASFVRFNVIFTNK